MTSPILWCGGEDIDFQFIGQIGTQGAYVQTTAGFFRSGYARCAIAIDSQNQNNCFARIPVGSFISSSFWLSCQVHVGTGVNAPGSDVIRFLDGSGIPRIILRVNSSSVPTSIIVQTIDAIGNRTQIGPTIPIMFSISAVVKLDFNIVYSPSGSINIFQNNILLFTFNGDITTDGNNYIQGVDFGGIAASGGCHEVHWSEVIVSTRNTRAMSLVTQSPVGNGATDTFTQGAASNVNEVTLSTSSVDYSTTAGQTQLYTVTAIPAGSFSILDVRQSGYVAVGDSGPQHIDFAVGTSGTTYLSSSLSPAIAWNNLQYGWGGINPNTGVNWIAADLNSGTFNIGYQSVT